MEDTTNKGISNLRDEFFGYLSAFVISLYGHRPGVLTNMTVSEVEAAKADPLLPTDTGYVITVGTELQTKVPHRLCFIFNVSRFSLCVL